MAETRMESKTIEDLEFEIQHLCFLQDSLLRSNGWTNSCENPMSLWLWEKDVNGKHITLTRDLALRCQHELDETEVNRG